MKTWVTPAVFVIAVAIACQALAEEKPKVAAGSTTNAGAVTAPTPVAGQVVARVNGTEIKRKELDAAVQALTTQIARSGRQISPRDVAQLEHDVLEDIVGRELFLQEGNKHIPADVDQKTQSEIKMVKKQFGGEERFKETLAETGITPEEYAKRVHDNVIVQDAIRQLVDKEVKITPEEIKSFYDNNPDQFRQPERVHASHILIRVPPGASDEVKKQKRAQIEAARALVKGGEKFADVAKRVSEDPGTAANGGDLGFFPRGAMVPEFEVAAFSLKTNELSDVITTQFGYHVLVTTGRKPAEMIPFDEVKDRLGQSLKQRKGSDLVRNRVAELRKTAKIEILLPPAPAPGLETPK